MWVKPKTATVVTFQPDTGLQSVAVMGQIDEVVRIIYDVTKELYGIVDKPNYTFFTSADVGKRIALSIETLRKISAVFEVETAPDIAPPTPAEAARLRQLMESAH